MEPSKQAQKVEESQEATNIVLGIKIKQLDYGELANTVLYKQFSFVSNHLLKVISSDEQSYRYKIHLGLCKMMEFNELELVYWHLLNLQFDYGKKLQPNYSQEIKICAFHYFKDFLKIQAEFIPDIALYKRELLFLTLSAFYTIKLLRNIQKFEKIGEFIKEDKFGELFRRIEPAFINVSHNLTLFAVNQKYIELTKFEQQLNQQEKNYNFIVEQILEMAPAYQKDEDLPVSKKVKRQKKLMAKKFETNKKQEQESQQKIEAQQSQQLQSSHQYQNQLLSQNEQQYLSQPLGSNQFSRQFNQGLVSQGNQLIQQDNFFQNDRNSFQFQDRQNSFGMQLRSNRCIYSQESLGPMYSNQFISTPPKETYNYRNQTSTQWSSKNGK
ncbi:unnamed protein product (macronuclear) [Paramecium tetraurelia]|uniref:Cyclin N-terminal domain-containing protein n=1 Tax=Paramecium tetraurelia TaxID=5888 RepID=A0CK58_PARTE|nr:uncharacterized protein GSPATT00000888001 [Paramecium tetraurelia]CAK71175.1 unnamed protein product [Paramecium tetraurelia]|eukprot:XP_001438572.1 hypothetical protein (macronuclear) [Paramecium tetraurelia strain d4-2]